MVVVTDSGSLHGDGLWGFGRRWLYLSEGLGSSRAAQGRGDLGRRPGVHTLDLLCVCIAKPDSDGLAIGGNCSMSLSKAPSCFNQFSPAMAS